MSTSYYPPSPKQVPSELTKLTSSYNLRASLAVASVALFFLLYFSLIVGLIYLTNYSMYTDELNDNTFWRVIIVVCSILLLIFSLKFLIKLRNVKPTNRIKLLENEQPEIWSFVLKICEETGAPIPKSIFVDPDVNAYVAYSNSWLSLIFPVRKELTIGLGLIDCTNLTEFKAILSHEFGHFSQRSMKIGSYIITANTIIHDMIYTRDKFDEILAHWRSIDFRLSAPAWIIMPLIWAIRELLKLFYQLLNLMYSSLSREMEFNADKVAVSTTGSLAIVSALWKLDSGFEIWNNTINNVYLASQKQMHVQNLYSHNQKAWQRNVKMLNNRYEELKKDAAGNKIYFTSSENSKAHMYASHPENNLREENAKSPFIEGIIDEKSPWILFKNKESLQEKLSALVLKEYLQLEVKEFCKPDDFEAFVKLEQQSKDLQKEYFNTFQNRFIKIDIDELENKLKGGLKDTDSLSVLKDELKTLMQPVNELDKLLMDCQKFAEGTSTLKFIEFNNIKYKAKRAHEAYNQIFLAREKLFDTSFIDWDQRFLHFHLSLANKQGKASELMNLYRQQSLINYVYKGLLNTKKIIFNELEPLQLRNDVEKREITNFQFRVNKLVWSCNNLFEELDRVSFIPLPNIENVKELKHAIAKDGMFTKEDGEIFENGGFEKLIFQLDSSIQNCQRVEQKNISKILEFHKSLKP